VSSIGRRLPEPIDALDLTGGARLAIVTERDGLAAIPMVCGPNGRWRRAHPGDGAAEALLEKLAHQRDSMTCGRFTIRSWAARRATGERAIGVDQTNESVIVGDTAVVKWAAHLQEGPHPAPHRLTVLRDAGFTGMPVPWGLVTWRAADGEETLVASVDEYLLGAIDGWTWAVQLITDAVEDGRLIPAVDAATATGVLVADLHAALASTATVASQADADRWHASALESLEIVCETVDSPSALVARQHRAEIADIVGLLGGLAGVPVIRGHGDLHVGQVLLCDGRFVVTDFDGNPVLRADERMLPIPAAADVAGMVQSLDHAAIVARKHTPLDSADLATVGERVRAAFLAAYSDRIRQHGRADLFDPVALRPFRLQQVLREIIYAARHLPRWMYVPDAALPALLDEEVRP
jgi:maltokinase